MTEDEWLMQKISAEIIKDRLCLKSSDRNIKRLAKLLCDFETEARDESEEDYLNFLDDMARKKAQSTAISMHLLVHVEV